MWNKITVSLMVLIICFYSVTSIFAQSSDLRYQFSTENKEEFLNTGETYINFNGQVPDYLLNIYDLTPQQVYNSEYGATIIIPSEQPSSNATFAPQNAPISGYIQGSGGLITGAPESGQSANLKKYSSSFEVNQNNFEITNNTNIASYSSNYEPYYDYQSQYENVSIEQLRNSDSSIGTIKISSVGLNVKVYDGDEYDAMKKGAAHVSSTSVWNGNIGVVGHNRGSSGYFSKLKKVEIGDEVTYKTNLGTRTYIVQSITKISEDDWSKLQHTSSNRITLLTCVEDVPNQRLCVQAVER